MAQTPGPLALLGSGEYTAAMEVTDRMLLAALGQQRPRVALIPTASGLEPGSPERWNAMGVRHFRALGAEPLPLELKTRPDAADAVVLAALRQADLFYFSGGNPEYLIETLHDTPAWAVIVEAHTRGAGLAGCSAGAMMLGAHTLRVREVAGGKPPRWIEAVGVAAPLVVMPHFDRMAVFGGPEVFQAILNSAPAGVRIVGIDEDTALVRLSSLEPWRVSGRQQIWLLAPDGSRSGYGAGEVVPV